jgi:uncharacterized iron-regulated membrane protein
LLKAVLEPLLKPPFIPGSALAVNNGGVKTADPALLHPVRPGDPEGAPAARSPRSASVAGLVLAALLGVGLGVPATAWADRDDQGERRSERERERAHDHDRAREAVRAGEAMPLPALLERLHRSHPGQVLELELEREDGRWLYEIRLLQPDGQLVKLLVDARTAEVLKLRRSGRR